MRAHIVFAVVLLALAFRPAHADDSVWIIAIAGGPELTLVARETPGGVPVVDACMLARDLDLVIEPHDDRIVIRDAAGAEWRLTHGSVLLAGPDVRALRVPAVVAGRSVYLPLDAVADLAARRLLLDGRRAALLPRTPVPAPDDARVPAGWERLRIAKTAAELAETRRLEGDAALDAQPAAVRDVLPPAHEALTIETGLGFAQGSSGAGDLAVSGTVAGVRVNVSTFVTYGRDGATYRSGRATVEDAGRKWLLEAGDLISDVRGLARGVRVGVAPRSWWRPSIGVYVRSDALSPVEQSAAIYRDNVRLPFDVDLRTEAGSDGSALMGVRWLRGRATLDAFYRNASSRHAHERGAAWSYDVWNGVTVQFGARISSGAANDRWYFAALSVPVANKAVATLERTRSGLSNADTSAIGLQLPVGNVRLMHRYQWTDVAFVREPSLPASVYRQLQSTASYSPVRRIQMSYQVATQWTTSATARQWTELQTIYTVSRSTSVHAVTGLPDVANPQRFRVGLQQNLRRGFRLAVDYGRLPAFQTPAQTTGAIDDKPRFLVMVRRAFVQQTPAAGRGVRGRVLDARGEPVAGAVVTLGPYLTATDRGGSYRFAHVSDGEYDLALDAARLPAQFVSDGVRPHVRMAGRDAIVDLHVLPLHAISGHVYIDRNGNGSFDPGEGVSSVVMHLSNGSTTMTNEDGAYGFYNLLPNRYQLRVDQDRLPRELMIPSPGAADVELEAAGRSRSGIDFRIAPRERPVVFQRPKAQ
jgi:SdrD B-like domain